MSQSLTVAKLALEVASVTLPLYSHPKSPRKFTQPQLLACLVLRGYWKLTFRGLEDLLTISGELREVLGLTQVPDHSTLQKFEERKVTPELIDTAVAKLLQIVQPDTRTAAMDSSGLEPTTRSSYYQTRSGKTWKRYVKLSVMNLCGSLLPCSLVVSRGPCNDKSEARKLLSSASERIRPKRLLADAGYDAEWVHQFCYETWKVRSYIPPAVHRADGQVNGKWRSKMLKLPKFYGTRWHVESFMSGLKRTLGSQLTSRKDNTLNAEAALRVLTYGIVR